MIQKLRTENKGSRALRRYVHKIGAVTLCRDGLARFGRDAGIPADHLTRALQEMHDGGELQFVGRELCFAVEAADASAGQIAA